MIKDLREKIILATIEVGADKGIENLFVRDIAKFCNVTSPAMYYHFSNKHELLFEAIMYVTVKVAKVIHRSTRRKNSFKENYIIMMQALGRYAFANQKQIIFYNRIRVVPSMELTAEDHLRLKKECAIGKLLSEGISTGKLMNVPNVITLAVYPLLTFLMHFFMNDSLPGEEDLNTVINSLWRTVSVDEISVA